HGGVPGRPACHSRRLLRGRTARRSQRGASLLARDATPARADDLLRHRRFGTALCAHLSDALHHHGRRTRQLHARPVDADLRDRLFLHEDGTSSGHLGRSLRHQDDVPVCADAHLHEPGTAVKAVSHNEARRRRRLQVQCGRWLGLAGLLALAIAFVFPILWMITTSFQAGEKMFQLTTEWIPSVLHPENYPNAWSRANFKQYFINSGIVSIAV